MLLRVLKSASMLTWCLVKSLVTRTFELSSMVRSNGTVCLSYGLSDKHAHCLDSSFMAGQVFERVVVSGGREGVGQARVEFSLVREKGGLYKDRR